MDIKKYFWDLNSKALKETGAIIKNPGHAKFIERVFTLLSRCDKTEDLFSVIDEDIFLENWPKIRRYWTVRKTAPDFKAWWETIYEQIGKRRKNIRSLTGSPAAIFKKIGSIIKEKRQSAGLSQKDMAVKSGLCQPDISMIESGKANVTLETLAKLCKILGIKNIPLRED